MRILCTGGGAVYEALYPLWKSRYDMHFVDANPDAFSPALPRERCHVGPIGNDPGYPAATAALCADLGADLLVPAVDEELPYASLIAKVAPSLLIMLPGLDHLTTMLDKLAMAESLRGKGLDVPRTVTFDRISEIGFPCFSKPRHRRRRFRGACGRSARRYPCMTRRRVLR